MGKYQLHIDHDRLAESRHRITNYYLGRPVDRIPFRYHVSMPHVKMHNFQELNEDHSCYLEQWIQTVNAQFALFPDADNMPFFEYSFMGEALIASMFGAEQVVNPDNQPYTRGRVLHDIDDLDKLPERIDPLHDGWGKRLFDLIDMCMDATHGEIPVCVCDHQSPYGIATKIMENENLILAMYDDPEATHRFLQIATNAIIDTTDAIIARAGLENTVLNLATGVPGGETGLIMWDDYVSVLNPDMHREFCVPYNLQLYERYGHGHLHTCGPYFPRFYEPCLACKPRSIDFAILTGATRTRADHYKLRQITRDAGIILNGYPVISEGNVFDGKHIVSDEAFLTDMALGGILPISGGSVEEGKKQIEMWKRISARVL